MRLVELANKPYPFELEYDGGDEKYYYFDTDDGQMYRVMIELEDGSALIQFLNQSHKHEPGGIIGSGDAFRVFATVAHVIRSFLNDVPDTLELIFEADISQPSRVKLYDAMAKSITRYIPTFQFAKRLKIGKNIEYVFRRIK